MEYKWTNFKGDALVKPEEVKGYDELIDSHKELFAAFLNNYYKGWEYPEDHMPLKVTFKSDNDAGNYLRVDFKDCWLHVKNQNTWY